MRWEAKKDWSREVARRKRERKRKEQELVGGDFVWHPFTLIRVAAQ
jgi:hypothetical protein